MQKPPENSDIEAEKEPPPTPGFNVTRVAVTALILAVLVIGGFVGVEYFNNLKPTLVKATGRVMWNGKPVTIGAVMTEHTDDPMQFSIGKFDEEGKFELSSNGEPGAALGTHKVKVASFGDGMFPPPLVPARYAVMGTTPLLITITKDPAKNHFELVLEGEAPKGGRGDGPPEEGSRPPASPPADAKAPESETKKAE